MDADSFPSVRIGDILAERINQGYEQVVFGSNMSHQTVMPLQDISELYVNVRRFVDSTVYLIDETTIRYNYFSDGQYVEAKFTK